MLNHSELKMLILSLTGQCNFSCAYCYADQHPRQRMSLAIATQALDLAAQSGKPFVLQFSGGEPLLAFEELKEIAGEVRRRQLQAIMQVQTNASLITQEIACFMRDAKIGVGISLDGRPEQNDALRRLPSGKGSSSLILQGAAALAAAKVEIGITCVVTDENVRSLPGIVEMAYYLGNVRKIGFDLLRAQGRGVGAKAATAQDLEIALQEVLATADRLERQTGRKMIFSHNERVESLTRKKLAGFAHCHAMNGEAAFVDADGDVYACASLAGLPEFRLGNIQEGIDPVRQQAIGDMIKERMNFCPRCPSFLLCGGACFARWYGAGEPDKPYPPECTLKIFFIKEYHG